MKKSVIFIGIIVLFVSILSSCSEEAPRQKYRHVETIDLDHGLFNVNTVIEGDGHSGKKFCRTDSAHNFGLGYSMLIPDSLKGKPLAVNVSGWTRSGDLGNDCDIVLTLTSNDSIFFWTGCLAREAMKNPNEWTLVGKEFILPLEIISKNNVYINVMAHNIGAKSFFDLDDLRIEYKELDPQTEKE